MRFQELARRELVFRELAPARESLLGQLEHDLERLRDEFETRSAQQGKGGRIGKNLPDSVEHLVLARQVADKVSEVLSAAKLMLHDLQGMARFESKASELHGYMNDYQQQYAAAATPRLPHSAHASFATWHDLLRQLVICGTPTSHHTSVGATCPQVLFGVGAECRGRPQGRVLRPRSPAHRQADGDQSR